jgi:hypothetical protein
MDTMSATTGPAQAPARTRRFDPSRWSGVLFVLIGVPGFVLGNPTSPYLDSADDYAATYADGAGPAPLGRLLGLAAVIALLWALARLRTALPPERVGLPAGAIQLAGSLYAATWVGAIVTAAATYSAVDHADSFGGFEVVPETAFVIDFIADGFIWASLVASAVLVWGVTLAAKRTEALPGWLCWVGFVLVPLLPVGWMLFMVPVLVFFLWFAAVVAIVPIHRPSGA